jgi:serine/threonine protein kinase
LRHAKVLRTNAAPARQFREAAIIERMSLASGRKLGPYEILSMLGAGGMGEVYRARDTRLDRTVAIKILPAALAANPMLRARFEREARAISALSHPGICALYDVGNDEGIEYLVMEYLEGESLAQRLARGPLPPTLVLRYGSQIAEALQQAHRAGIIHRDLKPGNIMLTSAGAKLLDFGLARIVEEDSGVVSASSPTQANPLTAEGAIVGTTMYMSPEQLEGRTLDHRTDIFSLGVVLYEMATGQRPFQGDSKVALIASILSSDPVPARSLQPAVSPALERIILTALEKNPEERWQTAQDVGRQLRWISESSLSTEQPATARRARLSPAILLLVTALGVGALTWFAARQFSPARRVGQKLSLQFAVPDVEPHRSSELSDFAISPDGRTLAFISTGASRSIYLRALDSYEVRKVEHTEEAAGLFWSSNGSSLGFSARGKLWKMRVGGGAPPEALCDISTTGARASWVGRTILFCDSRGDHKEVYRIAEDGGAPVKVTSLRTGEWRHSWPYLLPDGKHFFYLAFASGTLERSLVLASLDSARQTVLAKNISFARLVGKDRLLYVRDGTLLSQRFDADAGTLGDEVTTVASNVSYFYVTARADFDASATGTLVYRTDTSIGRLVSMDRKGVVTKTLDANELFWDHSLSPDGTKAAVTVETRATGLMDIWIYDLSRGMRDRFTSDPAVEVSPAWSPDGKSIVYSQGEGGVFPHLVRQALTGSSAEALTPKGTFQFHSSFTPDGRAVYFENQSGHDEDIYRVLLPSKKTEPFLKTNFNEANPSVSPDGRWLAYASDATGHMEVYVQSLAEGEPLRTRISDKGGFNPIWRGDTRELFYLDEQGAVVSALPNAAGRWDEAVTEELFRLPGEPRGFAVSRDGSSFLISYWKAGPADDLFHVVLDWK